MRIEDLLLKQREESMRQRRREKLNGFFMAIMLAIGFAVLGFWFFLRLTF